MNSLSLSRGNDVLRAAQDEVLAGEARLSKARMALREYRDKSQKSVPKKVQSLLQLISSLEQELTQT